MFKNILVPLDGSPRAERAILVAARIARASSAAMILARAVESPITVDYPVRFVQPDLLIEKRAEKDATEATEYLAQVAQRDDLKGLVVKTAVVFGSPALKVLAMVETSQADLIVMCSHGYTGFKRWMMGSVADKIVRHTPVPVLILREQGNAPLPPITNTPTPLRTLLTLDGSIRAEAALAPTVELLLALDATGPKALDLLSVVDLPATVGTGKSMAHIGASHLAEVEKQALDYLAALTQRLKTEMPASAAITINSSVAVDSDVAAAIIKMAESDSEIAGADYRGYDLIAMATHGRSGLPRWVMGSITERVLHATSLPLFIVRPKKLAETETVDVDTDKLRAEAEKTEFASWPALF